MVSLQKSSVISSLHSVESSTISANLISSSNNSSSDSSFQVDDAVYVLGYSPRLTGVVQYVGETLEMGNDCWLGLILTGNSQGKGDSDGLWKGVRYFTSAPKNGIFVKEGQVKKRRLTKLESVRLQRELSLPKSQQVTTGGINQSKECKASGSPTLAIASPKNQNTKVNTDSGCANLAIEQNLKSGGQNQKMEHKDPTRETTKQKSKERIHDATDITREDTGKENPNDEETISIDSKSGIENEERDGPEIIGELKLVCSGVKENDGLRKDVEEVKRKLALTQLEQRLKALRSLKKSIRAECQEEEEREDQESRPRDRLNVDRTNQLEQRLKDLSSLKRSIRAACQEEKREDQESKPHDRSNLDCSNLVQGKNNDNRKMNKLEELRLLRKHSVLDCRQTRAGDSMVTPLRSNKSCDSNSETAYSKIATARGISSSSEDRTADKYTRRKKSKSLQQDPIFTPSDVQTETKDSRVKKLSDYFEKHSKKNVGNQNSFDTSGCQNVVENSTETKEFGAPLEESSRSVQSSGSGSSESAPEENEDRTKQQKKDRNQITKAKEFCDSVKNKRDLELKRLRDLRKRLAVLREKTVVSSSSTTASSSASSILAVVQSKNVQQQKERLEKLTADLEAKKKENDELRNLMETSRRKIHNLTIQNQTLEGKLAVSERETAFCKSMLSSLEKTKTDDLLLMSKNNGGKNFSKEQQKMVSCRSAYI